jgi:SOS response regulatory protein OraA/RecX
MAAWTTSASTPAGLPDPSVAAETMPPRKRSRSSRSATEPAERLDASALRYLARQERTEAQVKAFLDRAGASPADAKRLVTRFHRLGYLNDKAYAWRWISARLLRRPMGRLRAEAELLARGFDPLMTKPMLDDVYHGQGERDLARTLLRQLGRNGLKEPAGRQAALLRRQGFTEDTIEDVLGVQEA